MGVTGSISSVLAGGVAGTSGLGMGASGIGRKEIGGCGSGFGIGGRSGEGERFS